MDPYQNLGVDQSASDQQIKAAFRKLAVQYHPDRGGDENKFKEINEAYQVLGDSERRSQYDTFGSAGFEGGGSPLQQLNQEIVDSMKPYAPGVPEDQLQLIVKDITFDMSPAEAQASAKANFIKLFGMATGGIATHFRKK